MHCSSSAIFHQNGATTFTHKGMRYILIRTETSKSDICFGLMALMLTKGRTLTFRITIFVGFITSHPRKRNIQIPHSSSFACLWPCFGAISWISASHCLLNSYSPLDELGLWYFLAITSPGSSSTLITADNSLSVKHSFICRRAVTKSCHEGSNLAKITFT